MPVIALDLGGTKLAAALFSSQGKVLCRRVILLKGRDGEATGDLVCSTLDDLLKEATRRRFKIQGVGLSVPGISRPGGLVWAPNIQGWDDYPLGPKLNQVARERCGPVIIDNDRACYILGEKWRGAAKGFQHAVFLAVGTGIGAGVLADGKILRGAHGTAGSIGWMALDRPFKDDYIKCGCFESYASGEGLAKVARGIMQGKQQEGRTKTTSNGDLSAADVFAAYARGDVSAKQVIAQAIEFWGMAVANLVSLYDPEVIVFGGGVFGPAARFLDRIKAEARKWGQPVAMNAVTFRTSKLGSAAGLYGAGYLALHAAEEQQ